MKRYPFRRSLASYKLFEDPNYKDSVSEHFSDALLTLNFWKDENLSERHLGNRKDEHIGKVSRSFRKKLKYLKFIKKKKKETLFLNAEYNQLSKDIKQSPIRKNKSTLECWTNTKFPKFREVKHDLIQGKYSGIIQGNTREYSGNIQNSHN